MSFFDCIEFNEDLRYVDVISEVAFFVMDLCAHARNDLAFRFLNAYLECTGDYAGLAELRYYFVYRAMVRAEIALLGASQPALSEASRLPAEFEQYLRIALSWTRPTSLGMVLTHGLSGSGKSVVSQLLLQRFSAIRLRSDVERKRMAGMSASTVSNSPPGQGLYTEEITQRTYVRLLELAGTVLSAGFIAIVDATFLRIDHRRMFEEWAARHGVAMAILNVNAPHEVIRERIRQRVKLQLDASEASLAVLERQIAGAQNLSPDEMAYGVCCDSNKQRNEVLSQEIIDALSGLLGRISRSGP